MIAVPFSTVPSPITLPSYLATTLPLGTVLPVSASTTVALIVTLRAISFITSPLISLARGRTVMSTLVLVALYVSLPG